MVVVVQRLPARRRKWRGFSCPPDGGRTVVDEVAGAAVLVRCFGRCGTTPSPQVPVRASGRLAHQQAAGVGASHGSCLNWWVVMLVPNRSTLRWRFRL